LGEKLKNERGRRIIGGINPGLHANSPGKEMLSKTKPEVSAKRERIGHLNLIAIAGREGNTTRRGRKLKKPIGQKNCSPSGIPRKENGA